MQNSSFFQFYLTEERFGIQISIKKKKKSQQYIHKEILSAHYDCMKFIWDETYQNNLK